MMVSDLLGINHVTFAEPNFESLIDDAYSDFVLSRHFEECLLLVDEEDAPLALLVGEGRGWYGSNFLLRKAPYELIEIFEQSDGRIFQEEWEVWMDAIREYYSLMLLRDTSPAMDDLPLDRFHNLRELLKDVWGESEGERCFDCCCGSGAGSAAMQALGYRPISYDNDPSLLALGLSTTRLIPQVTMCLDGRMASMYMSPLRLGAVFMAGTIDASHHATWREILDQLLLLTEEALITTGNREEIEMVQEWVTEGGWESEVFENPRDKFYDRWVCSARHG